MLGNARLLDVGQPPPPEAPSSPPVGSPLGPNVRSRSRSRSAPARDAPGCARVSPTDNYSSNMELAMEALIRMKMSQLAAYQSISGFKQDIKDGRTVSLLFPWSPPHARRRPRTGLLNTHDPGAKQPEGEADPRESDK